MNGQDPEDSDFAALAELAEVFTTLVESITQGGGRGLASGDIVQLAGRCVPAAEHVGLSLLDCGRVRTVAASSPVPERLEAIRRSTGQGPSLDVLETNDVVSSGDLADDPRWPDFGARAFDELGMRSVVGYRIYLSAERRAALTMVSSWPHAFDELALATGAIFAAYCSLTLFSEVVLAERLSARRAAEVHREIGVAVGILMATDQVSSDQAYHRLRQASRGMRQSLHSAARELISEHEPSR